MKTLIAILGIVLVGMTTICPLGCARHTKTETFAKYGLSFECPASYTVDEEVSESTPNTEVGGGLTVGKQHERALLLRWVSLSPGSTWTPTEEALRSHFERALADWNQVWEEAGYESVQIGEVAGDCCGGHSMLRAYYEFTDPDLGRCHGTIAETYCDESMRKFEFVTSELGASPEDDAVAFLRVFTSSFVCH